MADFFGKVMSGINKGASTIRESSKDVMSKTKMHMEINEAEAEKKRLAEYLGQQTFNIYKSGAMLPEELVTLCLEIEKRNEMIRQRKEQLDAMSAKPAQTKEVPAEAAATGVETAEVLCPNGHKNPAGARFCTACGAQID